MLDTVNGFDNIDNADNGNEAPDGYCQGLSFDYFNEVGSKRGSK